MLPPERILPELRKVKDEIILRDRIIKDQQRSFRKEYRQKARKHAVQVAAMETENADLLKGNNILRVQLAEYKKIIYTKILERQTAMECLQADTKEKLHSWMDEKEQLLSKIEALERDKSALVEQQ